MRPPAVACTLRPADHRAQLERWKILYAEAATGRAATDGGIRVSFRCEPAVEAELRALVAVEADCCSWATWAVEGEGDELVLEISSAGEGVAIVHSWFLDEDPALPASSS
jgi:hypothetical protein